MIGSTVLKEEKIIKNKLITKSMYSMNGKSENLY